VFPRCDEPEAFPPHDNATLTFVGGLAARLLELPAQRAVFLETDRKCRPSRHAVRVEHRDFAAELLNDRGEFHWSPVEADRGRCMQIAIYLEQLRNVGQTLGNRILLFLL